MRQTARRLAVLCSALFAMIAMTPAQAQAVEARPVPVTASDKYALKSVGAGGLYVSVEVDSTGEGETMLRARKAAATLEDLGSWEKFTLHTDDKGWSTTLRSEGNGNYVTTERNFTGSHQNLLRARGTTAGDWEKLQLEKQADGTYALKATTNAGDKYVTAEVQDPGNDAGLLRARGDTVGSWQKFQLVHLGEENASDLGGRPAPASPAPAADFRVMSWNVCANHNSKCGNHRVEGDPLGAQITSRMGTTAEAQQYRAVFLQEMCESQAKPIEAALEAKTGTGWDVRFAPIRFTVDNSSVKAARTCDNAGSTGAWKDRGSYGIGLAVPDANVWYHSYDLPSPQNKTINGVWERIEQRTAICAVLPAQALQFCTAHFSAGLATDDADGSKRREQAAELQKIVRSYTMPGYRTVYGGDLNVTPPDSTSTDLPKDVLTSAYAADEECDEGLSSTQPRDGRATKPLTYEDPSKNRSIKIDYLFGPSAGTVVSCDVQADAGASDHYPIKARFRL
ncbi:endonuclease/exonuclease/phosphatase family protein [Streptomyces sp. NPDC059352]|uniref:endonuclease/exonuclease/phosphatase family protein n=1 Tax=Streptomyces sp. NPDC059352 TaxID=3346810 RepID=UPI0036BFE0D0